MPNRGQRGNWSGRATALDRRVSGAAIFAGLAALCGSTGCTTFPGSLATDSGPSPLEWSEADHQLVHVGERVRFSFVLARDSRKKSAINPVGLVDYCIGNVGEQRIEATLTATGHYRFTWDMSDRRPGEVIDVSAAAYRTRGTRDIMKFGDTWVRADAPSDQPDSLLSRDHLRLTVYQSRIELPCQRPLDDLDMTTGRLEIITADGSVTRILLGTDGGGGFTYTGPDAGGKYVVFYDPRAVELNKKGTTAVRFRVRDVANNPHVFDAVLKTP